MQKYSAVIVGAGQAGVSLSYFLKKYDVDHIVLEKDLAFSAWRNRWDSFRMNTANWMNRLPGGRDAFAPARPWYETATRSAALDYFQDYLRRIGPPLKEMSRVLAVRQQSDGNWMVETANEIYRTPAVAICTGWCMHPKIPDLAGRLSSRIPQLHSSTYRRPTDITRKNVLIIGTGSSGIQICEDLAKSKRFNKIYLACSGNTVIPWLILGIPIGIFPRLFRIFDLPSKSLLTRPWLPDPLKGDYAMAPSPGRLASTYDIKTVGRVTALTASGIACAVGHTIPVSDLAIIWCTGFRVDYSFIQMQIPDAGIPYPGCDTGTGESSRPKGLYFLGLRYQRTTGSHLIYGVGKDARIIAGRMVRFLQQ